MLCKSAAKWEMFTPCKIKNNFTTRLAFLLQKMKRINSVANDGSHEDDDRLAKKPKIQIQTLQDFTDLLLKNNISQAGVDALISVNITSIEDLVDMGKQGIDKMESKDQILIGDAQKLKRLIAVQNQSQQASASSAPLQPQPQFSLPVMQPMAPIIAPDAITDALLKHKLFIDSSQVTILTRIDQGGNGEVYWGKFNNEDVAVKRVPYFSDTGKLNEYVTVEVIEPRYVKFFTK